MADGTDIDLDLAPAAFLTTHAQRLAPKVNRRSSRSIADAKYRAVAQWADGLENVELAVQARLSGAYVNVREFGATGDGTTDDTDAIQDAIEALADRGVGLLVIPPGTYLVSSPLLYPGEITISGAGAQATEIAYSGTGYAFAPASLVARAYNVRFQELTIDLEAASDGAIDLTNMSLAKLSGVVVFGSSNGAGGGYGFHVAGTTNGWAVYNRFDHCRALTCERGFDIAATGSNDTHITDCRATNCLRGVSVVHANHVVIRDTPIEDCTDGVWLESPSANVADALTVEGCRFEGNTTNFRAGGTPANIRSPNIHGNHAIGGVLFQDFDNVVTPNIGGNTGAFQGYERIISALAIASGVVMHRERTTAGDAVPLQRMWDSNTGSGTPTTLELAAGRNAAHVLSIGALAAGVVTENFYVTAAGVVHADDLELDNDLTFLAADAEIILGLSGSSGNARVRFVKGGANNQTCLTWTSNAVTTWSVQHDSSENLNMFGPGGAVAQRFENSGERFASVTGFRVGAVGSGPTLTSGTGVPAAAEPNGSFYMRTDGTAATTIYVRAAGAWSAIA